ncbi:helix-turn-helix domain-containing protein [Muricomes sp. OA1]|mgnify:CR=1 FL=1|uniref:helix-turn-helix domain-containing protein n=1 Tax=Muricomes sp. OA1 TaxID=2914165 RepID=UPI001F050F07|nr:helix-turn-helix transcriptional regulator [Muricomes sp. OA1]MCH1971038.1 helix-turn-helix domain-containing protein [Muricomes sp. OA1]
MYEIFERLLEEHGVTAYKVCKATGLTTATISNWKAGRYTPKQDKLQKIADYFGVSIEYIMTGKESQKEEASSLTKRDEKEINDILSNTEVLLQQEGLMFDGDPASPEAIESILSAMKIGMEMAKKRNKEKYTPKKYRKKE